MTNSLQWPYSARGISVNEEGAEWPAGLDNKIEDAQNEVDTIAELIQQLDDERGQERTDVPQGSLVELEGGEGDAKVDGDGDESEQAEDEPANEEAKVPASVGSRLPKSFERRAMYPVVEIPYIVHSGSKNPNLGYFKCESHPRCVNRVMVTEDGVEKSRREGSRMWEGIRACTYCRARRLHCVGTGCFRCNVCEDKKVKCSHSKSSSGGTGHGSRNRAGPSRKRQRAESDEDEVAVTRQPPREAKSPIVRAKPTTPAKGGGKAQDVDPLLMALAKVPKTPSKATIDVVVKQFRGMSGIEELTAVISEYSAIAEQATASLVKANTAIRVASEQMSAMIARASAKVSREETVHQEMGRDDDKGEGTSKGKGKARNEDESESESEIGDD